MDYLFAFVPSAEKGLLPRYLFVVAIVSFGNAVQNLATLHYTRRIYTGLFVCNPKLLTASSSSSPSSSASSSSSSSSSPSQGRPQHKNAPEDRVDKLVPAQTDCQPDGGLLKDKPAPPPPQDQVTPLAARLFGTWTVMAGLIRLYTSWRVEDASLYQLALLTHAVAAGHFTSEMLIFKTCPFTWPLVFPLAAGWGGMLWMGLQYSYYVQ